MVYVVLEQFSQLRKKLNLITRADIFTHSPPSYRTGLLQSVELQPGFYAILDPAPKLINAQLHSIQRELLLSFGVSALVTVLMLLLLLYRHVINPILHLDKQLEEVENNQRKNIENSILTMKLGGFPRVFTPCTANFIQPINARKHLRKTITSPSWLTAINFKFKPICCYHVVTILSISGHVYRLR